MAVTTVRNILRVLDSKPRRENVVNGEVVGGAPGAAPSEMAVAGDVDRDCPALAIDEARARTGLDPANRREREAELRC